MQNLKQIISVVSRKRISKVEIFDKTLLSKKDSKFTELYNAIESGSINSDQEASVLLYNEHNSASYRKLKSRFLKRLLNTLFFLDLNGANKGDKYRYCHYSCTKALMHAKLLRFFGGFGAASKVLKLKYADAKNYVFYDLLSEYSLFLLQYYGMTGNIKELKAEKENYIIYKEFADSESRCRLAYYSSIVELVKSGTASDEALVLMENGIKELEKESKLYPTPINIWHTQLLKFLYYEAIFDYDKLLLECEKSTKILEGSKFFNQSKKGVITLKKLTACLNLRQYEQGVNLYYRSANVWQKGSHNWFVINRFGSLLALHCDDRAMAYNLYNSVAKQGNRRFMTKPIKEYWAIFGAYCHFLLKIHGEDFEYSELESLNQFRLFKFLNEVPIYSRDKSGYNISLLVIQYVFSLLNYDYSSIIQKIDSLKVYRSRYLKNQIFKRAYTFIGMLLKLEKCGFDLQKVRKSCSKDLQLLITNKTGGGEDSENWPVHEWEIIPFERLWVYILKILEYNELPDDLKQKRKIIEEGQLETMSELVST